MTTSGRFQRWRRLAGAAQGLLWLGLPFVLVGGESALRLDVPSGRLHAFGASFAIDEAFVVLAGTLLATAAFLLVTLLYGRVWCGWSCPQTVLGDLTRWVEPGGGRPRPWRRPAGSRWSRSSPRSSPRACSGTSSPLRVLPPARRLARSGPCSGGRGSRSPRCCSRTSPPCAGRSARRSARTRSCRASSSTGTRSWSRTIAIADDCVDCGARARVPDRHRHPRRPADGVHRLRRVRGRVRAHHGEAEATAGARPLLLRRARHAPPAGAPGDRRARGRDRRRARARRRRRRRARRDRHERARGSCVRAATGGGRARRERLQRRAREPGPRSGDGRACSAPRRRR